MASRPCFACGGEPVGRTLQVGPLTLRSLCDVCSGSGEAHELTVSELLAKLHAMVEAGEVSPHAGVIAQLHVPDGWRDLPIGRVVRYVEAEGQFVALVVARPDDE